MSDKLKPIGYIDAEQIRLWEALRGTEYESAERCYMPWSSTQFKSDMNDCSMPVYSESDLAQAREEGRLAGMRECIDKLREAAKAALEELITSESNAWNIINDLEAALAEPEQEPVACVGTNGDLMWLKKPEVIYSKPRPLYTAPPRRGWVGLTDEEIAKVANSCVWSETYHIDFARAIEAKLREKNGG